MFQVGDYVYHQQFGRGQVAKTSGAHVEVMFDEDDYNDLVVADLPELMREEVDEGTGPVILDERTGRPLFIHPVTGEVGVDIVAPITGRTIYWNYPALDPGDDNPGYSLGPPPTGLIKEYETFKWPPVKPEDEGPYYTVVRAAPHFTIIRDRETGEAKMAAVKGLADYNLEDNKTGAKYRIQIKISEMGVFMVPRKVTADSLEGLMEEGTELF